MPQNMVRSQENIYELNPPSVGPRRQIVEPQTEPLEAHPRTPQSSGEEDSVEMPADLLAVVEGQLRLQKQTEQLAKRAAATQFIMEGQRRLEQQLDVLTKQMTPRVAPTPRSGRRASNSSARGRRPRLSARGAAHARGDVMDVEQGAASSDVEQCVTSDANQCVTSDEERYVPRKRKDMCMDGCYKDGHDDGSSGNSHGKGEEGGEHKMVDRPSVRSTLRLLSWRRNDTLSRLHGDTPVYTVAWLAEWVTCFAFTIAHLIMLVLWARHDGNQDSYVTTLFVTAIAAATYFAKACHMGDFMMNGIVVPLPRYIDWITTTPLMLYELCHIAHASFGSTFMVILCDLLMLSTGIIEAMIPWKPHKGIKQIWFFMSCWFFVLMLLVIHFDVASKAEKQNEVARNLFKQLEVLTVVMWSLYPIIVGIGRANTALITKPIEDILLCIMDVVAKIGMEGLIVMACYNGCIDKSEGH